MKEILALYREVCPYLMIRDRFVLKRLLSDIHNNVAFLERVHVRVVVN